MSSCITTAWQLHQGELRGYLLHRLSDASAADDVLQDVFVKALRQGRGFCALDHPRAWLFQVARNALVDRARTAHVHEPLPDELPESTLSLTEPVAPVDALADCVSRVLTELPAEDAAILRACDLQGQTQAAFAKAAGLTLPAAKSRLQRARKRLRDRLVQACQVRFDERGSICCHVPRQPGT
ncbi:MAG TPA: sigma-70 family RNA polymerase sigma factor [Ramlibacter sp.]|nr:sigma-70 family RNA polymerase sigma factor [Ramlibacter sp.]